MKRPPLPVILAVAAGVYYLMRRTGVGITDEEALARVIRSEIGNGTEEQRKHVAWVTRNIARKKGKSISMLVCNPRPVSSRQSATKADLMTALEVLAQPYFMDPTDGATHFLNPQMLGSRYAEVAARWRSGGLQPKYRLSDKLEIWT
jgi:hypothetical protein